MKIIRNIFIICFILLILPSTANSQSLSGINGLVSIPTAYVNPDKNITLGIAYLTNKYLPNYFGADDIAAASILITYLPRIELGLRVTHQVNGPSTQGIGDRSPNAKILIFSESESFPAIAVGGTDLFWAFSTSNAVHFNSLFAVASKTFLFELYPNLVTSVHLGYGSDITKAADYQFVGVFGGISLDFNTSQFLNSRISLMAEYDAERFNGGVRLTLFDHVNILVGLMGMDSFSGGMSVGWKL